MLVTSQFSEHRVGFQKYAVLRQSASKCLCAFICKIIPYMIDWESVCGVHIHMLIRDKCLECPPLRLSTCDFGETSEWQTSAKMCTGVAEGSHFESCLNPSKNRRAWGSRSGDSRDTEIFFLFVICFGITSIPVTGAGVLDSCYEM
jgi:hypothetical protein